MTWIKWPALRTDSARLAVRFLWRKLAAAEGDRLHHPSSQPARSRDKLPKMLDMADSWDAEADAYEINS